jgi:hypothetical protein
MAYQRHTGFSAIYGCERHLGPSAGGRGDKDNYAAVNSKREMVEVTGHAQAANAGGPRDRRAPVFPDWAMKQLVSES